MNTILGLITSVLLITLAAPFAHADEDYQWDKAEGYWAFTQDYQGRLLRFDGETTSFCRRVHDEARDELIVTCAPMFGWKRAYKYSARKDSLVEIVPRFDAVIDRMFYRMFNLGFLKVDPTDDNRALIGFGGNSYALTRWVLPAGARVIEEAPRK